MKNYEDLNEIQMDALREIGNIGSGNAATALASMTDHPVDISVPSIRILDYTEVVERLGGPEQILVGILLQLHGDVNGMIMFLIKKEFSHLILSQLGLPISEDSCMEELDEMSVSALHEVGNILAGSFVNAIGEMTGLTIDLSVPDMCVDMVGAILSVPAIYYADISDKIICIEDEMGTQSTKTGTHILLIPEVTSLEKIMDSLGLAQ